MRVFGANLASRNWALAAMPVLALVSLAGAGPDDQLRKSYPNGQSVAGITAPDDVARPPADALTTASGLRLKKIRVGSGAEHPAHADCVVFRYIAWKQNGSLQSTSGLRGETSTQCLPRAIVGIGEALQLMVEGEKVRAWIPSTLSYPPEVHMHGKKEFQLEEEGLPPSDLTVDLELVRIMRAPAVPNDLRAPPKTATRLPSGGFMEVLQPGKGARHPAISSLVLLHYETWSADGSLIEDTRMTGHPGLFLMGSVLPGWLEGLSRMVEGEKIRLWVPAELAFGEKPSSKMQPAGDLVYDIELISIQ
jgi:FKBP-type peptidyl-prolyl cis-trans isomerase